MNAIPSSGTYSTDILSAILLHWMQVYFFYHCNIFLCFFFSRLVLKIKIAILFLSMNKSIKSTGVYVYFSSEKPKIILKVFKLKMLRVCFQFNASLLLCLVPNKSLLSKLDHNSHNISFTAL